MPIREKLKRIVRHDRKNKKALDLKDFKKPEVVAKPGTGFDAALQPPSEAARPTTGVSNSAPRIETPPISPTALLSPSPTFSRGLHKSRSRSTTHSSRPVSSDSYTSSVANHSQTATTSNLTTPPNGLVASNPAGGSRTSLSKFKWGSRISLRSSYSGASDSGEKEGRKMSKDSLMHGGDLHGASVNGTQIPLIEENTPAEALSEEDYGNHPRISVPLDSDDGAANRKDEQGAQEVDNGFGRYLSDGADNGRGRSPYGRHDSYFTSPGPDTPDPSIQLQSPTMNQTFFENDSGSETSSNYEKSFISHDTSSLRNYISQFTAEDYRSTVGHIPRPPSRTSSECLPLDCETHCLKKTESGTQVARDKGSRVPPPSPNTSTTYERTVNPPVTHETYQEQETEIRNEHIVREIHTHEIREIEVRIKDDRPDELKEKKSPVHLMMDENGNLWPMVGDEIRASE